MSNIIGGTFVKEGKDSLELTANDLFDKIINLKFTCKRPGPNGAPPRSFTIRSDWEAVHHKNGTTSFKACTQKPDIKIEYKQVAESVDIEVNIYVTNFFMGDGDSLDDGSLFTASGDPVQWCTIQMGYRAQFPKPRNIEEYYNLAPENELQRGKQIRVQVLTAYPQSFPPDRVVYFQGIIGTMETGLRWRHTEADLAPGYGDPQFPDDLSEIGGALFHLVTRRFIRPDVLHVVSTDEKAANEKDIKQNIDVADGDNWRRLELTEDGILSVEDAKKYGIRCYLSKTLQELEPNALYGYGAAPEQIETMKPIPSTPYNDEQNKVGAQLVSFQQQYPFLHWYILMDGNYYFYHVNDTDEDLWSDPFIKNFQKENTVFLPAIYDMTPSGTRNIRCPFISFLSSMTTVLFQSRFTVGTLVSYFYPPKTNAFLVIISDVKFATVQDDNIMDLMCVDLPEKEVVYEAGQVKVRERPTEIKIKGNKVFLTPDDWEWWDEKVTVKARSDIRSIHDTEASWEAIIHTKVRQSLRQDRWSGGTVINETLMLNELLKWDLESESNTNYAPPNGKHTARGISTEGIVARTGINVPPLKPGDTIIVRHPFQSQYPPKAYLGER